MAASYRPYLDPFVIQDIIRESLGTHGTGFIHGSLTVSGETREELFRFAIEEYLIRTQVPASQKGRR